MERSNPPQVMHRLARSMGVKWLQYLLACLLAFLLSAALDCIPCSSSAQVDIRSLQNVAQLPAI